MPLTEPHLIATAGTTVDGRVIEDRHIAEMASSYDPSTYGARINMEPLRSFSADSEFRSYGDVVSLSTEDVEVNFNGTTETRLGLFAVFDVDESAKKLNDAGQKVFSSVEINDDFAGKGFSYLMGVALTDSPASVATERLKFNRQLPNTINLTSDDCKIDFADLKFAQVDSSATEQKSFLSSMTDALNIFTQKNAPIEKPDNQPSANTDVDATAMIGQFTTVMTDFAKVMDASFASLTQSNDDKIAALSNKFDALKNEVEGTVDPKHLSRSKSNGSDVMKTNC